MRWLMIPLLLPPILLAVFLSPRPLSYAFAASLVIPFFAAKSRRVSDPVLGIPTNSLLSPREFHNWAMMVCTRAYGVSYDRYTLDPNRFVDTKLPLVFSQVKAFNYVHARTVLLLLLITLDAYCVYDVLKGGQALHSPIPVGAMMGIAWGYTAGLYNLWVQCGRYAARDDVVGRGA